MRTTVATRRHAFLSGRALLLALVLVICPAGFAGAATIIVDWTGGGDYLTIQEGLGAAVNGDTVRVRSGTYTLPIGTHLDFDGKDILLTSEDGPESTIIETLGPFWYIRFESGESPFARLYGFTLDNCLVRIYGMSSPTISDNIFLHKGIDCGSGNPVITGNRFHTDDAYAVFMSFGFSDASRAVIENNFFSGDGSGIGIYYQQYDPDTSSAIRGNVVTGFETGIRSPHGGYLDTAPLIENNLVYENELGIHTSTAILAGNTIAFNENPTGCAGVHVTSGNDSLIMRDCVVWGNRSYWGNQIYNDLYFGIDVSHSLIEGGRDGITGTDPVTWGTGNLDADPLFLGGPAGLCYLSQTAAGQTIDSPCLDAGSRPAETGEGTTRTDQEDDTGILDMGCHHTAVPGLFICHDLPEHHLHAMEGGDDPAVPNFGIWQGGQGILLWTVSDDAAWLELSPTSGSSNGEIDEVLVLVDISGLAVGDHHAVITIDAPVAANGPLLVPITLTINQTWIVDHAGSGDFSTIQEGLDAAVDYDVVQALPGTYTGDGNRDLDFGGKAVTLVSEAGPALTTIDAEGGFDEPHRCFHFQGREGPDSVVRGFTLQGGFANEGGGIRCGPLCSPTISGNVICGNNVEYNGGGIHLDSYSVAVIEDNLITGNSTLWTMYYGRGGGGIYAFYALPEIRGNRITNNHSDGSGGGLIFNLPLSGLQDNLIAGNTATGSGGGLYFDCNLPADISNCTIVDNHAAEGGGFYVPNWNSPTTLTNCILWGNQADGEGHQGYTRPPMTVRYSDVQGGEAGIAGDGPVTWGDGNLAADPLFAALCECDHFLSHTAAGQPSDSPCVDAGDPSLPPLARTTRTDFVADLGLPDMGFHYEVLIDPQLLVTPDELEFRAGTGGKDPAPQTIQLANGGPYVMVWTAYSSEGWLQLDAVSGTCQSGEVFQVTVSTDITGLDRGYHQATILIDAPGAANAPRTIPVLLSLSGTFTVEPGGGGYYATMQQALDAAVHGDTIEVAAGTYTGPENMNLDFGGTDLSLVAVHGPAKTIIDCQGAGRAFIFQNDESRAASVSGFTITNGLAEMGGAILLNDVSSPTISNCRFVGNEATSSGGAVFCRHEASPLLRENLFIGNQAGLLGGGLAAEQFSSPEIDGNCFQENLALKEGGGLHSTSGSPVVIRGNRFEGNRCTDTWNSTFGGGVYAYRQILEDNIFIGNRAHIGGGLFCNGCELANNLVTGNHAHVKGGGAYLENGGVVRSTTLAENMADAHGGGIFIAQYGSCDISDSILWGNQAPNDHEISIGLPDNMPLSIEFSDIQTTGDWISDGVDLTWGKGNLEQDPLFVEGQLGSHLLSQVDAGQSATSPCVNSGDPASAMIEGTTRTDGVQDAGILDMGFHHPAGTPPQPYTNLVTGPGPAPGNPPLVRVFPPEQNAVFDYEFPAYGATEYGVNVATGYVDGDGSAAILTGAGPGEIYGPHVRGFQKDGTPLPGLSFLAYGTNRYGVNVCTGDLDNDGYDEIITGAGPGAVFGPHVRGWDYDGTPGVAPVAGVSYFAYGTPKWGVNVSCGDIDGDGFDEIVTGAGPGAVYGPHVRGWNVDGGAAAAIPAVSFLAYGTSTYGVNVTCGDVDGDGMDEIITGPGPGAVFGTHIRGWDYDGQALTELPGLNFFAWAHSLASYGANVFAGGDLDGDGRDELVVGCGPDPDVATPVKVYFYDGTQVTQWFSLEAFEGLSHGTTVAAGRF